MSEPAPTSGYLIITAINAGNGAAGSETYQLRSVLETTLNGGSTAQYVGRDVEDDSEWVITAHPVGEDPPEVRPYRELIQALIAADEPCHGLGCPRTLLGHLLATCTPEQVEMVRALDPNQAAKP